jgi:MtfA peptidase
MIFFYLFVVVPLLAWWFFSRRSKQKVPAEFPTSWRLILDEKVLFYHNLSATDKFRFEADVLRFIARVRITGVNTEVDITDKLLVASSAAIPVFGFPHWDYTFLDEVLLYPDSFNRQFQINSQEEIITGMVGSGTMEGKVILSKPALHRGFDTHNDKQNVGVHEFIHLLDKEDGSIDGIPATLQGKEYALPWLNLVRKKTQEILKDESDIDDYAATHHHEFLTVAGEYFFEQPQLLQKNHPELYALLSKAFNQDTAKTIKISKRHKDEPGRNDPCPCGSGKKFKKCCMN